MLFNYASLLVDGAHFLQDFIERQCPFLPEAFKLTSLIHTSQNGFKAVGPIEHNNILWQSSLQHYQLYPEFQKYQCMLLFLINVTVCRSELDLGVQYVIALLIEDSTGKHIYNFFRLT